MVDRVDARRGDQRRAGAAVAVHDLQHARGQLLGEHLGDQRAAQRRPLAGLEHDRVAGRERGGQALQGDRDRVVPGRQHDDDAAGLEAHDVGGVPAALQRAAAVQRAELGVLLQAADAGLDAAA